MRPFVLGIALVLLIASCDHFYDDLLEEIPDTEISSINKESFQEDFLTSHYIVNREILLTDYFQFIEDVVSECDTLLSYPLSEYILLQSNPWIIDVLINTDYYIQKDAGIFIYDQKLMTIFNVGDKIYIPNAKEAHEILSKKYNTVLDLNIPEYKLRIIQDDILIHTIPVRVGRNEDKYLETAGRMEDLRTKSGKGFIESIERNPSYINPVDGRIYETTLRDDKMRTMLPQIPFFFPVIDGCMHGQLIHPTTNPKTLGRAYSNGCIGVSEGDAWKIYAYAPVGTTIEIRYDLEIDDENGETIVLKDIYKR